MLQRLSAVYLALFATYLVLQFLLQPPADHGTLVAWMQQPLVMLGWLLLVPLLIAHAWVGVRNVLMDYLKPLRLRVTALALTALALTAGGLWLLQAVLVA